ncbi:YetF domain-containing protein [Paenibacillus xylanilyticus]|uniref:DUF421 domain-containing protein n=1 Tax=Paenibacillus xylanilyticus TaxID=248903 RepID=A0A7Y6C3W2_9BACL|nr:YetF domain-containing protein [Paenibacillus xylanilyticus]NUU80147.1 DUF421 domain-containing protein [Paenibacillus xylanilyticus]
MRIPVLSGGFIPRIYNGNYLEYVMKNERIRDEEILQAARNQGGSSMHQVEAVVLEPDGSLTVMKTSDFQYREIFNNIKEPED